MSTHLSEIIPIRLLIATALASCLLAQAPIEPPKNLDVGVYFINSPNSEWRELPVEIVSWKTGGVLKSAFTEGIIKKDLNGRVNGRTSRIKLSGSWSVEILIFAVEGTAGEEYQLLKLRPNPDSREFRSVTGGVFHQSGGARRDSVDFSARHVAPRTWRITLDRLTAGEYGFLPPVNASSLASSGKMYTFKVGE